MITLERLTEMFNDENKFPYKENIDHTMTALSLLRERIPYEICKRIIQSSDQDIMYLCDVNDILDYIDENDVNILMDCNFFIHEDYDCLACFV
jgi:hypothetical protein